MRHRAHGKVHKAVNVLKLQERLGGAVGVCCPKVAEAEIFARHALEAPCRFRRAIRHYDHARVLAKSPYPPRRRGEVKPRWHPDAVFTSALSSGQCETASEPSFMDSVSRFGEATEPLSRWSRPITMGALSSPRATMSLNIRPARWRSRQCAGSGGFADDVHTVGCRLLGKRAATLFSKLMTFTGAMISTIRSRPADDFH